jgi:hypothetical protein
VIKDPMDMDKNIFSAAADMHMNNVPDKNRNWLNEME